MPGWRALGDPRFSSPGEEPPELPTLDALLAFASKTWEVSTFRREWLVRKHLGISDLRFWQLLYRAIDDPAAWSADPTLMKRVQAKREVTRARRWGNGTT